MSISFFLAHEMYQNISFFPGNLLSFYIINTPFPPAEVTWYKSPACHQPDREIRLVFTTHSLLWMRLTCTTEHTLIKTCRAL